MSFFRVDQPVLLATGEGTHLGLLGEMITLLLSGSETHGAFTALSETSPPGAARLCICTATKRKQREQ